MKLELKRLVMGLLMIGLVGCQWQRKEDDFNGPLRVQIPFAINGQYGLHIIDLLTLTNLSGLQGSAARFLMDPAVQDGRLVGTPPSIRYMRNSDGVIIPKDDMSLQMLTVYAHIERLQTLDNKVGAQGLLRYPRTVAINAEYRSGQAELENNALYSGQYDALLIVPYTEKALPVMANGGIIAHEHFHALFNKLVIAPLGKSYPGYQEPTPHSHRRLESIVRGNQTQASESEPSERDRYHAMVLRGLNEGLADVWGWVYSGDTSFVAQSLPSEKTKRDLNIPLNTMVSRAVLAGYIASLDSNVDLTGISYELGNQIARAVKGLAGEELKHDEGITAAEIRLEIGKTILGLLPELQKKFASLKPDEVLSPSFVLTKLAETYASVDTFDRCNYLMKMVPESERDLDLVKKCKVP